ncbi:dihydrodipicolinate synthase family protein [Agrobacterium fabrum]|uniref:4-hydroxy-tetrahydrodipicolinate synthase n=1 Tax=Agrobacterium fabrum TaxID=1176649 RepID=A0A7Z7BSM9_9HYPH|nr:dihydrodipicolinate synthase family protein [Agrobacterium fabrum]MCR6727535.1 dihydrodipicolinate synthase family protein [Agrobacterium fabrum]WCK79611.1 dihydrodipicolinate synthase family protein [Agrobacterium fabrum]WLP57575.1 dihydrodipicolinate synthase family protein [Agrobacterium fabrum]CUX55989.1 Dihydrodipicolinate synthase/N-acetylneuraminate lyase [Agrobacterium fabrum str. J-07]SDB73958.1 4-hydroxy-tetrahydrodipicolinate synthase [Agrobacterium fabrum]
MSDKLQTVRTALSGISGVPVTPYKNDGSIDIAKLKSIIKGLASARVHNLMAAGNTGEFFTLTMDEVREVHAATVEAAAGKSLVSAAVGRSLTEAKALAKDAVAAGADAIMGHHPMDPFAGPSYQANYFLELADFSTVPVIAYVRSDAFSVADFRKLALHPNIAGIKFASSNLMLLAEVIRATADAPAIWVCGLAEGWAPAFYAMGAKGFTSGLVNVFPERSHAIHKALEAGDYAGARGLINAIAGFEALRTKYNNGANVTVVKEALGMLGNDVGPVRVPGVVALNEDERSALRAIVDRVKAEAEALAA